MQDFWHNSRTQFFFLQQYPRELDEQNNKQLNPVAKKIIAQLTTGISKVWLSTENIAISFCRDSNNTDNVNENDSDTAKRNKGARKLIWIQLHDSHWNHRINLISSKQHNDVYGMKTGWKSICIRYVADNILNWCASLCTRTARHAKLKKNYLSTAIWRHIIKYSSCDIKFWHLPQRW